MRQRWRQKQEDKNQLQIRQKTEGIKAKRNSKEAHLYGPGKEDLEQKQKGSNFFSGWEKKDISKQQNETKN